MTGLFIFPKEFYWDRQTQQDKELRWTRSQEINAFLAHHPKGMPDRLICADNGSRPGSKIAATCWPERDGSYSVQHPDGRPWAERLGCFMLEGLVFIHQYDSDEQALNEARRLLLSEVAAFTAFYRATTEACDD